MSVSFEEFMEIKDTTTHIGIEYNSSDRLQFFKFIPGIRVTERCCFSTSELLPILDTLLNTRDYKTTVGGVLTLKMILKFLYDNNQDDMIINFLVYISSSPNIS